MTKYLMCELIDEDPDQSHGDDPMGIVDWDEDFSSHRHGSGTWDNRHYPEPSTILPSHILTLSASPSTTRSPTGKEDLTISRTFN